MTSRNSDSNARLARRLLGSLADVDKLGLDRRSTDEEPIDIGLLGYQVPRISQNENEKQSKEVRSALHSRLRRNKEKKVDQD